MKNSMEELITEEQRVDQYIEQGQKELAVKLLYDLIIKYAKLKDFTVAESLRDRLIEIDNLAVSEIVNSAEIIEEEKSVTIDAQQLGLWKQYFDSLTPEESNAFYFAGKRLTVGPDRIIIKQGMLNDKLFFINEGRLKLIFRQGEKEIYIKQINKGEIVGQDTFFSISICTSSVISMNDVQLTYLDYSSLQKLEKQFPGFENRLQEFCFKSEEKVEDILRKKKIERRRFKRFEVSGEITTQLFDKEGKTAGKPFQGHLKDLSEGGVCYFIKCSQKSLARHLLGRPAKFKISYPKDDGRHMTLNINGRVAGVNFCSFNDYTVHASFSKLFPEAQIRELNASSQTHTLEF